VSFAKQDNQPTDDAGAPNYPTYAADSPVSGSQDIVRHSAADKNSGAGGSWGFLQTIGSIISHSLYW